MQAAGNLHAEEVYGAEKVNPGASKEQKQRFVVEKYEKRAFAGKAASAQANPQKNDRTTSATPEGLPVVRKTEPVPEKEKPVPMQYAPQAKVTHVARETTIPDNLFDELFNEAEDSYLSSRVMVKAGIAEPKDCGLDAFLNTTLSIEPEKKSAGRAGYPIHLDPFQKNQTKALADVFADWPEF
jgi:hypothetical protein